ncbi:MAG: hypothetical protein FRX48_04696 [Lasallia pustulata]|uniref:Uncharacterized protein n=1 Tax=Lasallia pustulata TaxID=136370 RepID=A0A5M8PPD3_9LECA|nr:MAG: hypothetical protein FRX48_04696 [Lasallia pustulata]
MSTLLPTSPSPSRLRWTLGFLLVGLAWGLTTPFIRRAAVSFVPTPRPSVDGVDASTRVGWARKKVLRAAWTGWDLLRTPGYAVPLVVNLTGSVVFLGGGEGGVEFDGADYEFVGVSVYGVGGVVGRGQGDFQRYLDWDGVGAGRYRALCAVEERLMR